MTIPFAYRYIVDRVGRGVRVTIPCAYRYIVARVGRGVRVTIPCAYRYITDRVGWGVRAAIPFTYRCIDRAGRGVRATIPFTSRYVDRTGRSVRAAIPVTYRYVDKVGRGARAAIAVTYRYVDRVGQSVRAAIPVTYRYVDRVGQGVRATVPVMYRYVIDRVGQGVRATVPITYRYVDRVGQGVRAAIAVTYRYVIDGVGRGGRATILAYRYVTDRLGWGVRVAIPFTYRYVIDRMGRGVRAIPFAYRYVTDSVGRGVRVTISLTYRYVIIAVIALAVLAPLCLVLYQSFLTAPFLASGARLGLDAYRLVFADEDFGVAFGTTLLLGASMTLIAVPLGAVLAFLVVRTDVPGRRWLEPLILVPIFVSAVVLAFGYVAALGPAGLLTTTFKEWTGAVSWNLYSFPFLVAIAGLTHVPHVYVYTAAALRGLGSEAEEVARAAGAKPWRVAIDVSLPMVMPAILFAGALVFFLGFELFGLPLVLGDPQGLLVLSTYLYKLPNKLGVPSDQLMAVVIVTIVAITLPLVFMQRLLLSEVQRYISVRAEGLRSTPLKLGGWRWLAFLAIALWLAATVLVPLAAITLRSFVETWGEGIALAEVLTLDHYRALIEHPNVVRSIVNTLGIGLIGGAAAVAFYTAIALTIHRWPSPWTRAVGFLVMVPRAMPGLVAGLALLWLFLFFKLLTPLRETLISVWLAYTLVWLAYGMQLASGTLLQVDPRLEDVARTVGATQARVKFDVTLPLIRNGMLASWLLIFLIFVREYSTGVYLLAPGTEVIGSLLVSLWGAGAIDLVSALSVVNMVMIGVGLFFAIRVGVRVHG